MSDDQSIATWEAIIKNVVANYTAMNDACTAARLAGTMDIEGPLHAAIWITFESMLGNVDPSGWVEWFIYENECGKRGLKAKCGDAGKPVQVRTAMQLARIIVKSAR